MSHLMMQFSREGRYGFNSLGPGGLDLTGRAKLRVEPEPEPRSAPTPTPTPPPLPEPEATPEPPAPPGPGSETPWPRLTSRDITATFKVVGDLAEGTKVKIVDDRCLAVDDSYISGFYRSMNNQGRERLKSYLDHLLVESKRVFHQMLVEMRQSYLQDSSNNSQVNDMVSELRGMHGTMMIFLHKFDVMKRVYQADSKTYADLGIIRDGFYTFSDSFYRELVLGGL